MRKKFYLIAVKNVKDLVVKCFDREFCFLLLEGFSEPFSISHFSTCSYLKIIEKNVYFTRFPNWSVINVKEKFWLSLIFSLGWRLRWSLEIIMTVVFTLISMNADTLWSATDLIYQNQTFDECKCKLCWAITTQLIRDTPPKSSPNTKQKTKKKS